MREKLSPEKRFQDKKAGDKINEKRNNKQIFESKMLKMQERADSIWKAFYFSKLPSLLI